MFVHAKRDAAERNSAALWLLVRAFEAEAAILYRTRHDALQLLAAVPEGRERPALTEALCESWQRTPRELIGFRPDERGASFRVLPLHAPDGECLDLIALQEQPGAGMRVSIRRWLRFARR